MPRIADDLLIDSYSKAIELKLCPKFITLLEKEISLRSLPLQCEIRHDEKKSPSIS
ncbi:sporulation histidine kinase inhibitor Sda [Sporosarcina oncorhynchi]|uniref:Sporulation histidine kinase inhibitor Sda n=1 Tax=Sporosarcina oncorhynchi TaxID=3056444 RepID=A0ABZ0L6Y2_9BACL|nr:sporulation histidine kinase inhibitor Sda [Sporosarcina sp. T2O-4]WOV88268.1 sporulation histidine kinase inhibitor Sda [Sporosarcina sp. T2O-4]